MESNTKCIQNGIKIKIEVCIDSVESALAAIRGGADRLEICGNLALGGGTTPSIGLVRFIKYSCPAHIELMVMIRPRTGDFIYSSQELAIMLEDIRAFAQIGIVGVVFGVLSEDGTIDVEKTRTLVNEAVKHKLQVCFHRAFDMVVDQTEALSTLCKIPGITRILTRKLFTPPLPIFTIHSYYSGGKPSALAGLTSLISLCSSLHNQSQNSSTSSAAKNTHPRIVAQPQARLEIMPGSGVNAHTITPILRALLPFSPSGCLCAVHMSGGSFVNSGMLHCPQGMGMGVGGAGEWGVWRTSDEAVRAVRQAADVDWDTYIGTTAESRI